MRGNGAEAALNGRAGPGKLAGAFGIKELKQRPFLSDARQELFAFLHGQ